MSTHNIYFQGAIRKMLCGYLSYLELCKGTEFLHADNQDRSDFKDAHADLSLCWAPLSEGTFSQVVAP